MSVFDRFDETNLEATNCNRHLCKIFMSGIARSHELFLYCVTNQCLLVVNMPKSVGNSME